MIAITISLQSDAIVATSMAGEEVWRATEANISGRELKQALKEAIGHANFLMVTPEAEKLAAGAQGVQDQLRALANRKHPTYHRLSVNARFRAMCLPSSESEHHHGCPVWKPGRPRRLSLFFARALVLVLPIWRGFNVHAVSDARNFCTFKFHMR